MGNYFVLECYGPEDQDRAALGETVNEPAVHWNLGQRFTVAMPSPIEVHLDPEQPGLLMPMFERGILLMRDDVIATLTESGVDNLDLYPAVLVDLNTSERHENYKAVNIIGLVRAADLSKSAYVARRDPPLIDTDFDKLAIDEAKAHDLPLFRLGECVSAKLIHRRVKENLEKRHPYLDFIEPENWMG